MAQTNWQTYKTQNPREMTFWKSSAIVFTTIALIPVISALGVTAFAGFKAAYFKVSAAATLKSAFVSVGQNMATLARLFAATKKAWIPTAAAAATVGLIYIGATVKSVRSYRESNPKITVI